MRALERFYQTMRMHFAFEQMCYGYDELALTLCEDGRYFAGLPFFEKYKYDPDSFPEVDYSSAGGDLLKEMQGNGHVLPVLRRSLHPNRQPCRHLRETGMPQSPESDEQTEQPQKTENSGTEKNPVGRLKIQPPAPLQ